MKCYLCDQELRDDDSIAPVMRFGEQPKHLYIEQCVAALARELKQARAAAADGS